MHLTLMYPHASYINIPTCTKGVFSWNLKALADSDKENSYVTRNLPNNDTEPEKCTYKKEVNCNNNEVVVIVNL